MVDDDDVIGRFGEDTCNASGNKLISLFHEVELVACNGRQLVSEPEWTKVRPNRLYFNGRAINGSIGECDSS